MSETVGIVLAAINGIGIMIGGVLTVWKSVATTNVTTLEQRLAASEQRGIDSDRRISLLEDELTVERNFSTTMAHWGHEVSVQAATQGISLPDMPRRRAAA